MVYDFDKDVPSKVVSILPNRFLASLLDFQNTKRRKRRKLKGELEEKVGGEQSGRRQRKRKRGREQTKHRLTRDHPFPFHVVRGANR